jgi:tetratricopeptide (TPR) repeat protein
MIKKCYVVLLALMLTAGFCMGQAEKKAEETGDAKIFIKKCVASIKAKDADSAIKYGEQAVALDANNSNYYFQLGLAYNLKINQVEMMEKMTYAGKMLDAWKKAVALDGKNLQARQGLIGFYLNAPPIAGGSVEKAKEQANEIIKEKAMLGNTILAQVYAKENNLAAAKEAALKALKLHLDFMKKHADKKSEFDANALNTLGYALMNANNYKEAIEIFQMNVKAFPKYFNTYDSLAEAYMKSGDKENAIKYYKKAMLLNPQKSDFEKKAYQGQQAALKKLEEKKQ